MTATARGRRNIPTLRVWLTIPTRKWLGVRRRRKETPLTEALAGLRDKLFDELGLMFAARSDNARKLVMPIAELEEISDTDALSERFMSRLHSARCVELMKTLTKAFFDEAVAIMIIDEASSEPPADSAKQ